MPDRTAEEWHLELADWHIAKAEKWLDQQHGRVDRLIASGHDATEAEKVLSNIADFLDNAREHRRLILSRLNEAQP
jgi:hypothetical protein